MNTVEVKLKTFTEGVEESDKVMKGQEEQFKVKYPYYGIR